MAGLLTPDQMQANAYALDTSLQNAYNADAAKATEQYNAAYGGAQTAQSDLSNFTKNMQSGTDIYAKALQAANANAGYDVNNLNQAQNQVSQLTGIMGGLPRAIQASNANYGATAGNVANQYSTTAGNLNQSLGLANTNAANQIAKMNAGLTGAQQGTSAQVTTQDQQRQSYAATAANAVQIMGIAQTQMDAMIKAQQQGQQITAQDQAAFGQLKASYAAAAQAYATARAQDAQAAQTNLVTQQTRDKAAAEQAAAATTKAKIASPEYIAAKAKADESTRVLNSGVHDSSNWMQYLFGGGGNSVGSNGSGGW